MPYSPGQQSVVHDLIHVTSGVGFYTARSRTLGIPPGVPVLADIRLVPAPDWYSGRYV